MLRSFFAPSFFMNPRSLLTSILAVSILASMPAAEIKIGTVNMAEAFVGFYKTKQANEALQENNNKFNEDMTERTNAYKKLVEEVDRLDKERRDPVLSMDGRAKKQAEFENKAQEVRATERELGEFQQRRKQQLNNEMMGKSRELYDEISKAVQTKAKAANLDMVIDKSARSVSGTPTLLYIKEGATPDITAEVIVELNKDAPAGTPAPATQATAPAPAAPAPAAPAPTTTKDDSPPKKKKTK